MTDLHTRLLARCDDPVDLVLSPQPFAAALRAVVELHAPKPCPYTGCTVPHQVCSRCGSGIAAPCDEIKLIARELGVQDEVLAEKLT